MKRLSPLTTAERVYADRHIGVLYYFLKKKNLSIDEYYGVASLGYLEAVHDFVEKYGTNVDYGFYGFAEPSMMNAVSQYRKTEGSSNRDLEREALRLDALSSDNDGTLMESICADDIGVSELVEQRDTIRRALSMADETVAKALVLYAIGYSMDEVSSLLGVRKKSLQDRIYKFRREFREAEGYVKRDLGLCAVGWKQERNREAQRRYRERHREKIRAYNRQYGLEHRAQITEKERQRKAMRKERRASREALRWDGYI